MRTSHVALGIFCHVFGSYRTYEGCCLFGKGHSKQAIGSSRYSRSFVIRAVTYKRQCALVLNERMKQPWAGRVLRCAHAHATRAPLICAVCLSSLCNGTTSLQPFSAFALKKCWGRSKATSHRRPNSLAWSRVVLEM